MLQTLITEDREPFGKSWQYALGRLAVIELLMRDFPSEFEYDTCISRQYERSRMVLEFGYRFLNNSHPNVLKLATKVSSLLSKLRIVQERLSHRPFRTLAPCPPLRLGDGTVVRVLYIY